MLLNNTFNISSGVRLNVADDVKLEPMYHPMG